MHLKQAAGWNQTGQDWLRLMALEPEGCFGIDCNGILAATTTALCYGDELAWIGMVLTLAEFRGRGFAGRLMECALKFIDARGVAWTKLDATDMGAPLYRKFGFEDEQPIERWIRQPAPAPQPVSEIAWNGFDGAMDRQAFGADRGRLLSDLSRIESARIPGGGYAMGRPGSSAVYFGPCVSRSPETASELLAWFLSRHAGDTVYWDLLPGNANAVRLATGFGFECGRKLVRMARRGARAMHPLRADYGLIYAMADFAYG